MGENGKIIKWKNVWIKLNPYRDIIRFAIVLFAVHAFWKYTINYPKDNLASYDLTWFGIDIAAPFIWMTNLVAEQAHWLLATIMGKDISLTEGSLMRWSNGSPIRVVWGCSGLKQIFIFTCIILFARGPWKHKTWYIPCGIIICHIYNVLRIVFLTLIVENHLNQFPLWHDYILKYLFYGIIFFMWVVWHERFHLSNK